MDRRGIRNVLDRIRLEQHEIGDPAGLHGPQRIGCAKIYRRIERRGLESLTGWQTRRYQGGQLIVQTEPRDDASRTELIVLITPTVVSNAREAKAVTRELRKRLKRANALTL